MPRDEIFLTTKLWNDRQGRDEARRAFDESLQRLGLPSVDLFLIHWPCPQRRLFVETWKTLIQLRDEGRAKSIGVSNFTPEHIATLLAETGVAPSVNQIELHPHFQRRAPRADDARHGIVTESWSPLGQGKELNDPAIVAIAKDHGKSPAQVVLRWQVQIGCVAIPKTAPAGAHPREHRPVRFRAVRCGDGSDRRPRPAGRPDRARSGDLLLSLRPSAAQHDTAPQKIYAHSQHI